MIDDTYVDKFKESARRAVADFDKRMADPHYMEEIRKSIDHSGDICGKTGNHYHREETNPVIDSHHLTLIVCSECGYVFENRTAIKYLC